MPELITSAHNPLVKQIRSLRQKKGREAAGLFLAEGIHPVGEAIQAGGEVETLVYAPEQLKSEFAESLVNERLRWGLRCVPLEADLFTDLTEKENPQGILAVVRQRHLGLQEVQPAAIHLAAALVSPQDPGNVGTILRTLDAVGAEALFLLEGGVELYHPSVVRASMGTLFWKTVIQASFRDFAVWTKENRFLLVGTSAHAPTDYRMFKREGKPVILVFGSEQKGLSAEEMERCDVNITLPMKGRVSSLNLAVAAGVLLFKMVEED